MEARFENATYRTNPRYAMSPTYGAPVKERTPEERAEARERVKAKVKIENVALAFQRARIAQLTVPKHIVAANDNHDQSTRQQTNRKAA